MRAAAWLAALVCLPLHAAGLTHERAHELYMVAYGQYGSAHGGIPLPDKAPVIRLVRQNELRQLYGCQSCEMQGVMTGEAVYLNDALDFSTPFAASVVVHEFIHYFQHVRNGPAKDCQEAIQREYEAYGIQLHLLERAGVDTFTIRLAVRALRCPKEG